MEFRMLGPFEAWHDGQQVDLGDFQQRYVLVVLLLHLNRPVSPQRLIEIIWGTSRPRSNLIPGYVAKLRKAFTTVGATDSIIEKTTTGYVLRADEDQLDTARFAALCAQARAGDRQRATELLRTAVDLWRGRFLEDLDIDRVGGSEVISPAQALIDALGDLAELELAAGNHRWVRDRLRPVVHDEPSRHRHTLLLMRALLANGDQVEAMKVYHRTRDALDEAGLQTPVELRREAWAVRYGAPSSTLPPRPGRFTGRAAELASIEAAAAVVAEQDEPGVLWVSGMPGVGKTALAIEAAHRLGRLFPDARVFVALDGFTPNLDPITPTEALAKLLVDLGVPTERIPPTLTGRSALYQATLAGTKTVVVLDNAASAEQVRSLLPQAPGCLAIVTSRRFGDLDAGDNVHVAPFPATDAAQLFNSLVGPDRLRGRSAEVTDVVGRCGRLPLQIKMVASQFRRHRQWPLDHLVRLLDEAGPWNSARAFDNPGVVACMVSYQQLDEPQRTMFRLFGANPGHDLSVAAAAAFAGDDVPRARQLLDDLHEVSLLEEAVPERYHILDPLKQFAESVATPAERDDALDRLLDFYLVNTASAIATAFPFDRAQQPAVDRECAVLAAFGDQQAAHEWLTVERPNLVAAIRYAAGHGRPVHTWQLAVLLWRYFNATNHIDDWIDALELAKQTVMADEDNQLGQAHVLLRLAVAHRRSGRLAHARELAAQALPRWVRLGDLRGEADTLCAIAKPTIELGDHGHAIAHLEAALAKYEQVGDLRGQGNTLSMLGLLNEQRGNLELAERQHVAAVRMLRLIDDRQGLAHGLDNLGSVRQRLGAVDEALADHQEAHGLALATGDRGVAAYALNNIGNVHRLRHDVDEAMRYQEEARLAANGLDDAYLRTELYLDRGATLHVRGDQSDALRSYRAALDLATGTGDRAHQAQAHRGIAQALHTTGDHDRAADHWRAAETTFVQLRQPEAGEIRRERQLLRCACTPDPRMMTTPVAHDDQSGRA